MADHTIGREVVMEEVLRDAGFQGVAVRVRGGALVVEGAGTPLLGRDLRAIRDRLVREVAAWDAYTQRRLRETYLAIADVCPPAWRNHDEDAKRAFALLDEAATRGDDAAAFETALWRYQLATYSAFRRFQRARAVDT
jgi:hypothetical protein